MTQDIDDLIARLETKSIWGKFGWEPDEDARSAAAALREQRDEIARLTILVVVRTNEQHEWIAATQRAEADRDAAMKDAERWRWYVRNQLDREGRLDAWADRNMANDAAIAKEKG